MSQARAFPPEPIAPWVVWPKRRQVDVWHPGDATPTTLGVDDTLDGEDVIPGFSYPIAALFANS